MKTIAAVFPTFEEAQHVARHLEKMGVAHDDINIVAGNDGARHDEYLSSSKDETTSTGVAAASAASFGGGVGIVASLIALAIPGVGPIVAGGALATVLTGMGVGAAAGGLVGAFSKMGISHEEAQGYEDAIREGRVFMAVHVNDPMEQEVSQVMSRHGAKDVHDTADISTSHPDPYDSTVRSYDYRRE